MLKYEQLIRDLQRYLGYPEWGGEAFKGNPKNPLIFEEYYLWDIPSEHGRRKAEEYIRTRAKHPFKIYGNLLIFFNK